MSRKRRRRRNKKWRILSRKVLWVAPIMRKAPRKLTLVPSVHSGSNKKKANVNAYAHKEWKSVKSWANVSAIHALNTRSGAQKNISASGNTTAPNSSSVLMAPNGTQPNVAASANHGAPEEKIVPMAHGTIC